MKKFFSRSNLYRNAGSFVILAALILTFQQTGLGQASREKVNKEPRALGLIELLPKGKARLIPVVILIDGQYYDAGSYKASPVPMALWAETEYEGFRSGISQGLFTVTEALENPKTNEWIGEGTWQTADQLAARKSTHKPSASIPRGLEDDSGPPVLRHSGSAKPKPPDSAPTTTPPPAAAPAPSQGSPSDQSAPPPTTTSSASPPPSTPAPPDQEDPNRPTLKRGKPAPSVAEAPSASPAPAPKPVVHASAPSASAITSEAQLIPAISDSGGPEAHSYSYDAKPDEELTLRNKMLTLAADEVRTRVKQLSSELTSPAPQPRASKAHPAPRATSPNFSNVRLRLFDLSSSNEPVMVLSASAQMPEKTGPADLEYFVTVVGRQDINGDIHKAFSNVTDNRHLDVEPKFELVDAVDVDGDGRAELVFRKLYDEGSAFAVYRVIGDQLYALFEGTPIE